MIAIFRNHRGVWPRSVDQHLVHRGAAGIESINPWRDVHPTDGEQHVLGNGKERPGEEGDGNRDQVPQRKACTTVFEMAAFARPKATAVMDALAPR
jgi:hypothetical protein